MKRKIAIVAGGDSSEHAVSLRSAAGINSFLDPDKYDIRIVVLKGADWRVVTGWEMNNGEFTIKSALPVDKNDFSYTLNGEKIRFDFAYITIHGTPGENGLLQGYFEMMHIPYSCCNVLAAALTFNKFACNHYLQDFGYRIAKSMLLRAGVKRPSDEEIVKEIGLPCFIKSNVGGSSFGCTKVKTLADVTPAIDRAFKEGNEVICESFMKGTEVTCGVYRTRKNAVAFPVTEVVTHNEFFDYDAKYKGQVEEITPARIPDEVRDHIQELTLRLYDIIGCRGIIRTDYILTRDEKGAWEYNLLEVNTTPGMTATSFIPQQVRAAGLEIREVLTDIIENEF